MQHHLGWYSSAILTALPPSTSVKLAAISVTTVVCSVGTAPVGFCHSERQHYDLMWQTPIKAASILLSRRLYNHGKFRIVDCISHEYTDSYGLCCVLSLSSWTAKMWLTHFTTFFPKNLYGIRCDSEHKITYCSKLYKKNSKDWSMIML